MFHHFIKLFLAFSFFLFFCSGCVVKVPKNQQREVKALAASLYQLNREIPYSEALKLSQDVFSTTQTLTQTFKLTSPPQAHNFLVNVGLKEKGLCYHWSDALFVHLKAEKYPAFDFHLLGANIGDYWSEHNVMVVVSKGKSWESGVLLDPWRNSGRLYFSSVKEDTKYTWKHRPQRGCF